jgi:hypothetical protein
MRFVRNNELVCSGAFSAADGSGAQPASAELVVVYTDPAGASATEVIPLVETNGVWSGAWSSSNAGPGRVDWSVRCWNGLVAASQGSFELIANRASMI